MTLAQMQARFFELKGKLAVGQIQEEVFKRELERLRFQDFQGRWWMIGAQSGRWYYYDGARWLLGDPPEPPPLVITAGDPAAVNPAAAQPRPSIQSPTPTASAGYTTDAGQTISVPYTYVQSQPPAARSLPPPQAPLQQRPAPGSGNGSGSAPSGNNSHPAGSYPANYPAASYSQVQAQPTFPQQPTPPQPQPQLPDAQSLQKLSLADTLRQDLGKVHLPHVQMPQLQRPNLQSPNLHIPPQFLPNTSGAARQSQPPFILIGAVVVGLLLVALMWLAVDNLIPGRPIGSFFGRAFGAGATAQRTPSARQTGQNAGAQNIENFLRIGDELASKSQFEPALSQYQAAAKLAPNEADVYTHWARALSLTGRIGEAIQVAQRATRLDPTSSRAFAELTRALAWAGETDQAVNAGEKAIDLDSENATAQAFLAEAYLRAGRTAEAQQTVDKALELDDSNPDTHRAAGWIAILSGRNDEGVGEWKRAVELAQEIFLYQYELGLVYANHLNDPEAAIPEFQRAIQLYPPYIPSYTALGRAYLASNQPGPAILQFQKALTLDPKSSDAFLGLGQAFLISQRCPQGIPYFQKALELDKNLAEASKGLEDCGAIAKGSALPLAEPTQVQLAPVATSIPQATVAPLAGNSTTTRRNTPAPEAVNRGPNRIYFPVYDGQYRVYSANPDGSDRQLVVELASSPSVNSDGTLMLYHSWVRDQRGIHRIETNGVGDRHISLRSEDILPSWSPDGTKYVYSTRAGLGGDINRRAFTVRVGSSTSKPRQDPNPIAEQAQYPAWGPNNTIVFRDCGFPDDVCGLAIVGADGTGKRALTNINSTAPAWSPDGGRIVFMSNVSGNWDIYAVGSDGGSPERLTDALEDDGLPVFSPDGSKIAFASRRNGAWSIWQIDADGENEVKLFDLEGSIAGEVPGNSPAQPGQIWTEQRISWR